MAVVKELEAQGIQVKGAEMTMIANTPSAVSVADAKKVMRLIDKLEELEDLQAVYHTMDITDEIAGRSTSSFSRTLKPIALGKAPGRRARLGTFGDVTGPRNILET